MLPPPTSYFGGKTLLRPFILPHLDDDSTIYVEPFCGSANILFAKRPHAVEVLNDLDQHVVNFFRVLQHRRLFRHFAHRVRWTPYSRAEFIEAIRVLDLPPDNTISLDRAWAFFVRGTLGFSGSGDSAGNWRRSFEATNDIATVCSHWRMRLGLLEQWRDRLLKVQIDNRPALEVMQYYDSERTTFYIDPPYVEETRVSLNKYAHEMDDSDHAKLVQALLQIKGRVVLSGYPSTHYDALVKAGWLRMDKPLLSSMSRKDSHGEWGARTEVLWINRPVGPSLFDALVDEALVAAVHQDLETESGLGIIGLGPGRPFTITLDFPALPEAPAEESTPTVVAPEIAAPAASQPAAPAVSGAPAVAVERPRVSAFDFALAESFVPVLDSGPAIPEPSPEPVPEPPVTPQSYDVETPLNPEIVIAPHPLPIEPLSGARVDKPMSLAQFLNTQPVLEPTWIPSAPPSLDGIDELIVNVETNGLKWQHGDRPIGVTVGTLDGQLKQFLPFGFRGQNLDEAVVKRWAERELRGKAILNTNTRFDLHMFRVWGVDLTEQHNTFGDIRLYAALIDDHRKRFALDVLAEDFLGGIAVPRVDERMMMNYEAQTVAERAEYQVTLVAQLRDELWPELEKQDLQRVRQLEDDFIPVVVECEKNGALIDLELLAQMTRESEAEYHECLRQLTAAAGFEFDGSDSCWQRLFEKENLPITKLGSGKSTFKDAVLARIDHPTVKLGRYAAQLDSLRSKIFKPYTENVGPDGILHFDLHQLRSDEGGTISGRCSAAYIQQVPNHENHFEVFGDKYYPRRLYIPRSGLFLSGDAEQIEYRLFSHFANNPKVIKAYQDNPHASFHKMIHPMLARFKADISYTSVKRFNFMVIYGGGLVKTAVLMGDITEEEGDEIFQAKTQWSDPRLASAREVTAIYARELPEVKPLIATAIHLAKPDCDDRCDKTDDLHRRYPHRGFITTLMGRRGRFPTTFKIHKAFNMAVQGTAADIMKQKSIQLYKLRKELGLTMRFPFHDETCNDVPDVEQARRVQEVLNIQSMDLRVPILWSVGTGPNWAAAK